MDDSSLRLAVPPSPIVNPPLTPGQPATPRMLRSWSNSVRSSKNEVSETMQFDNSSNSGMPRPRQERELLPPAALTPPPLVDKTNSGLLLSHQHRQQQQQQQPPPQQQQLHQQQLHQQTPRLHQQQQLHQQTLHAQPRQDPKNLHGRSLSQHHLDQPHQQQQQFHRKSIGDWDFVRTIGAGSMGKVKLARHNATNEKCAVKIVPRAAKLYQRAHANDPPIKLSEEAAQRQKEFEKEIARDKRTIREGALGRLLFHPHICRLYEMVPMTNHYYMLFEYVEGGQLLDYIVSHGSLNEKYARKFARGIALALNYCHKNNVVHRDLKIENIMINQKGDIKIIDFGLSNLYMPKNLLKTYCGSLYFAAPELLSAKPYVGPEVDVWSFGVVLYVLVCGKVPFDDPVVSTLHEKIKKGHVEYPSFLSKECVSLLQRMLVVDPLHRATLEEVIQHPWMNRGYDNVVPSYMPRRAPLSLPLDPDIILTISSLDLGSVSAITEELNQIVGSREYQYASDAWSHPTDTHHNVPDATGGFHPLVSIYYLVDEMRKRRKAKEDALRTHARQTTSEQAHSRPSDQQLPKLPSGSQQLLGSQKPAVEASPGRPESRNALGHMQQPPPPPSIPALRFPEQVHALPHASDKLSLARDQDTVMRSPSIGSPTPRASPAPETLDPNGGKASTFNSIFRKLSTKSKGGSPSPTRNGSSQLNDHFSNSPLPDLGAQSPRKSSASRLSPQSSVKSNRADPLVRRGVSMKVTAKEKSSSSTVNLAKDLQKQRLGNTSEASATPATPSHSRAHARTPSASSKPHGFTPVEYLPPLPNIVTSSVDRTPSVKKQAPPATEKRRFHPTARAKSVGGHARRDPTYQKNPDYHPALPNNMAYQNSDEKVDAAHRDEESNFDDVKLDVMREIPPALTEEQIIEQFNNAKRNSMPSIEYPRTSFLKGFFSVQTTSTKPLPVIRYNIICVLSKLGVKFQEVKGGFVCVHSASVEFPDAKEELLTDLNTIIDEYKGDDDNSEERKLYGDAFKSSSDSISGKADGLKTPEPEYMLRSPQQQTKGVTRQPSLHLNTNVATPTQKGHRSSNSMSSGHRRKFSFGQSLLSTYRKKNGSQTLMPPNTPAAARLNKLLLGAVDLDDDNLDDETRAQLNQIGDDDSVDSLSGIMIGGGSDMLDSSRIEHRARARSHSTTSGGDHEEVDGGAHGRRLPLKFEINIVKLLFSGFYGVQFKKTLGNTWNYKTLASQILHEVNL